MIGIVGKRGFLGSNLARKLDSAVDISKFSIDQLKTMHFESVYICAPSAKKYVVNSDPKQDMKNVKQIIESICEIRMIKNLFLFSTIDVFANSLSISEPSPKLTDESYGGNRAYLENRLRSIFEKNLTIARLCGLFGPKMVKNVLFDYKFKRFDQLKKYNPNSKYQYMNIDLAFDIALSPEFKGISVNVVSEPISIYQIGIPIKFLDPSAQCIKYDVKTQSRKSGYFIDSKCSLDDIESFLND
jgi:nucleoside-diphosphate-sugar epimerase